MWRLILKCGNDPDEDSSYEIELLQTRDLPGYPVMCCEVIDVIETSLNCADLIVTDVGATRPTKQAKVVCAGGDNRVKSFVGTPLYVIDFTLPFS